MNDPALKQHYLQKVIKTLAESRHYKNVHQIPALEKVVINSGVNAIEEKQWIEKVADDISKITGQRPITTKARESISNFKLREGMPVGVKVTLRGARMYEFLDRFLNIALPNARDFRGVSSKLDGCGNYTIGVKDHTIFPEIKIEDNKKLCGMDITIVTTAKTDAEGFELLKLLGMPFRVSSTQAAQTA